MRAISSKTVAITLAALVLAGCTIPRSGPYGGAITGGATDGAIDGVQIVQVNGPISVPSATPPRFSEELRRAGPVNSYQLGAGDLLSVQVWEETVSPSADGTVGLASISLPRAEIDERGEVFVPFAGRIKASGRSVSRFHEALTQELSRKLVNPQVSVARVEAESMKVNVIGAVTTSGPVGLSAANQNLLDVLTRAGGPTEDPEVSRVTVMRGGLLETLWLGDVYGDRSNDIAMRAGDTVLVERDDRSFIVLGAVNEQTVVPFPARRVSVLRALAEASGLNDSLADPTGVFVFRPDAEARASGAAAGSAVYVLDLDRPNGMLLADGFELADGDMVYVTNAPITSWLKVISAISPALGLATSAYAISQ